MESAKIKEIYVELFSERYWRDEMTSFILDLVGSHVRSCDCFENWLKFDPIQKMVDLGYSDRLIAQVIDTSKLVELANQSHTVNKNSIGSDSGIDWQADYGFGTRSMFTPHSREID